MPGSRAEHAAAGRGTAGSSDGRAASGCSINGSSGTTGDSHATFGSSGYTAASGLGEASSLDSSTGSSSTFWTASGASRPTAPQHGGASSSDAAGSSSGLAAGSGTGSGWASSHVLDDSGSHSGHVQNAFSPLPLESGSAEYV